MSDYLRTRIRQLGTRMKNEPDRTRVRGNQLMIEKVFNAADAAMTRTALRDLFDKPSANEQRDKRIAAQMKRERKQNRNLGQK